MEDDNNLLLSDLFDLRAQPVFVPLPPPSSVEKPITRPLIQYEKFTQRQLAFHAKAVQQRILILIDGDFSNLHNEKNRASLTRQLMTCCNVAGGLDRPCLVCVCGIASDLFERIKSAGGMNWVALLTSKTIEDIINDKCVQISSLQETVELKISKFIYLTADAEDTVRDSDLATINNEETTTTCFIVGGMIDRNSWKGRCKTKAEELNIATAMLPLKSNTKISTKTYHGSRVLTSDQVVSILQYKVNGLSWEECFLRVIPPRHLSAEP